MIDNSEQATLTEIHLCNSCKGYKCAFLIEQTKEHGSEPLVKKCNGYKKKF